MKYKVIDFTPINVEVMAKSLFQPIRYFDRGIKSRLDFAPINKSLMANKLPSTNLERFLRRIKSRLIR